MPVFTFTVALVFLQFPRSVINEYRGPTTTISNNTVPVVEKRQRSTSRRAMSLFHNCNGITLRIPGRPPSSRSYVSAPGGVCARLPLIDGSKLRYLLTNSCDLVVKEY